MFAIDRLIGICAVLVLFAVASSKLSARAGLPILVVFIGLGMLAGSEGVGGLEFENYALAHGVGTVALALILFDGGLRTSTHALRAAWKPALTLATGGVLITAALTGAAASLILGIPLLHGMLLGSIVGSTDAAAVFSALRGKGTRLPERLGSTLEIESGSNDPMAVFLTVGLLEILLGRMEPGLPLIAFFLLQMSVGLAVGLLVGRLGVEANNRINLDAAGLYPVLMGAIGFLAFGLAASVGGSGFLAVYVAGVLLGNSPIVFKRGIFLFMDGMAWLGQIVMFTMLGLLSFPGRLLDAAPSALLIALVLILVARPLAVVSLMMPFGFNARELAILCWGGLRGAVPIILATYPLLFGLSQGEAIFDVVFFVVVASATTMGWSLPWLATRLGLQEAVDPEPVVSLEITALRHVPGEIVEYVVVDQSKAAGKLIRELALPDGAVVAMVARGREVVAPRGSTRLIAGDHAFLMVKSEVRRLADRVFAVRGEEPEPLPAVEFPLSARMHVSELVEFYGIAVDAPPEATLEQLMRSRLEDEDLVVGSSVRIDNVVLRVREVSAEGVEVVGLEVLV